MPQFAEFHGRPAVSVIVPVYNRQELVRRALHSLLLQDFHSPIEIIVVDDGSTDGSADSLTSWDPRIRVMRQSHRGAAIARYNGIKSAHADVVAFLDSDDIAPKDKLRHLYGALKNHTDCVLAFGVSQRLGDNNIPLPKWYNGSLDCREVVIDNPLTEMIERSGPFSAAMNIITYRKAALGSAAGRSFYKAANDYDLQLRLAQYGKFVFVAAVTSIYELTDTGITRKFGPVHQAAYSLCSAYELYDSTKEKHSLTNAFGKHVDRLWPSALVALAAKREWKMLWRVLWITATHGRFRIAVLRQIWWTIDDLARANRSDTPWWIRRISRIGRFVRKLMRPSHQRDREEMQLQKQD